MKLNRIICIALAACMLAGGADAMAQKRKPRKTAVTPGKRPGKAAAAVTGPAIDDSQLINVVYQGFVDANINGLWMFQQLKLEPNDITWEIGGSKLGGSWEVTGNALSVKSGGMSLKMKSPDGGIYFTGKCANGSNGAGNDCFLYRNTLFKTPVDTAAITKKILDGKYTAFVSFYRSGKPELGAPVKLKMTPGENPNEGTYKITSDNEVMAAAVGVLRGTYKFDEKGFHTSKIDGSGVWWKYENLNRASFWGELGEKSIPGLGNVTVFVYFFIK